MKLSFSVITIALAGALSFVPAVVALPVPESRALAVTPNHRDVHSDVHVNRERSLPGEIAEVAADAGAKDSIATAAAAAKNTVAMIAASAEGKAAAEAASAVKNAFSDLDSAIF